MTKISFKPWVGEKYEQGINGKKVLVLGESHYCKKDSDATPDITINVIKNLFDSESEHEGYKNTYTKFIRALSGDKLDFEGKRVWWNKIVFYNYVQTHMPGPRIKPSVTDFRNSENAFFEILETYRPDCVIVWGQRRLYNNLPQKGVQGEDLIVDDADLETWTYQLEDGHIVHLMPMKHPSAAYSPEYWHKIINAFIAR